VKISDAVLGLQETSTKLALVTTSPKEMNRCYQFGPVGITEWLQLRNMEQLVLIIGLLCMMFQTITVSLLFKASAEVACRLHTSPPELPLCPQLLEQELHPLSGKSVTKGQERIPTAPSLGRKNVSQTVPNSKRPELFPHLCPGAFLVAIFFR